MSGILRLVAIVVVVAAWQCTLATESLAQAPEALLFRRVFVPEEALESEIRGLLPLKRDEFERRLALAARQADSGAAQADVRIEQATFRGRVDRNRLIDGTAELEVVSTVTSPALLPIAPCNVAIKAATWQADRRPAVIGAGPDGCVQCLVDKSGTLRLEWVHAASPSARDETTFELQLPAAARRELEIAAKGDVELSMDDGLLVAKQPRDQNSGEQVWHFALSGNPLTRLHARSLNNHRESPAQFVVRETSTYAFFGSSLDVETSLILDGMTRPRKTLELKVDRGLEITAVRLQHSSLPLHTSAEVGDGPIAVSVQLPEEFSEATATLQISATADWSKKDLRSLPRMRLSDGLFQEGRMVVSAGAWLRLQARPVAGCVQTNAMLAAAGRSGDRFEFQLFEPTAEIEISTAETAAPLVEESGTQITVDSSQVRGVLIAELSSASASHFEVVAQVPRPWVVDSVEAQPPEMLAERLFTMPGGGPRQVRLKLAQALTPQRPLRLVIRAHYRRPANNRPLGDAFFGVASFPEAQTGRELVAVRVNDPGAELQSADGGELPRLDATKLTASELRLFESPPGTLLLERGTRREMWPAMLRAATARFRADVLVCAKLGEAAVWGTP